MTGKAHPPPVPPKNRAPHESEKPAGLAQSEAGPADLAKMNVDEQGRQGNSKQDTTNKGYQQDR